MADGDGEHATGGARAPFELPPPIKPLRSLRVKLLLVVAAVALAPLALVGAWSAFERNIDGDMRVRTSFTADEVATAGVRRDDAMRAAAVAAAQLHGVRVRVYRTPEGAPSGATMAHAELVADADFDEGTDAVHQLGTLFFGPDGAPSLPAFDATLEPVLARPEIEHARVHGASSGCRASSGAKLLVCHGVRVARGKPRGEGGEGGETIVYVQESSRRAVRALYDLRYQLVRLSMATIPLALMLAYWLGKRVVGPLEALRSQALARAGLRPGAGPMPRLSVRGQDEITDLAAAFDALLAKLQQRQGENERFVADLVHEFKNPVAAIRAAADAVAGRPLDEARAKRLGKVLLDSSARLDALVSQFLELARAEAGLSSEPRARVDMAALAHGLVESMRVRFDGVRFEVHVSGDATVHGVPHGLDSALRNLVENAASFARGSEHGPPEVVVDVRGLADHVTVAVRDTGPGIADEDLARVFTRFFTTRGRARGTGLGLALVRATVEAHGGTVSVASIASGPGSGATFEMTLPRDLPGAGPGSHRFHTPGDDVSSRRDP